MRAFALPLVSASLLVLGCAQSPATNAPATKKAVAEELVPLDVAVAIFDWCSERNSYSDAKRDECSRILEQEYRSTGRVQSLSGPASAPVKNLPLTLQGSPSRAISSRCTREWPGDGRMQQFCRERQNDGLRKVRLYRNNIENELLNDAFDYCEIEWGTDFAMQAFCMDREADAVEQINLLMRRGMSDRTASRCSSEWLPQLSMVAYCMRRS
ncbi:MAG: hypothetical protein AAF183_18010 [Pseudomonadota bacterium]